VTGELPGGLDEPFLRALDSMLDLVVLERAVRDEGGAIVDFVIEWMNSSPGDVAGRRRDDMIGRRISELYPALAGGELIDGYRQVVETGVPMTVEVMPYEDVIDGVPVAGFYTVQVSRFEDGVLVASRDITALETSRRDLESALHRLEETLQELEAAQRLAQLGTWRIDLETGAITMSSELRRRYATGGDVPDRLDGLAPWIHEDDAHLARAGFEGAMRTHRPAVVEHRVRFADGSIGHVRSSIQPVVVDERVVAMWGTTQDITERVANQVAFADEHASRLAAETRAEFGTRVSAARTRQEVADAAYAVLHDRGDEGDDLTFVVLSVIDEHEPVVEQYFGGPGLSADIEARYRRTSMGVDTPITRAIQGGGRLLFASRTEQHVAFPAVIGDGDRDKTERLAVVPFTRADGRPLGALVAGWRRARAFDPAFVALAEDLAATAGQTVQRLDVIDLERSIAQSLQLSLLALDVRSTRVLVRARYRAAEAALAVGGDWYDVAELGDGRLAVAVGDVVGRGLPAATTMGQLRAALGVAALRAADATEAVGVLDRYADRVPGANCATVAFGLIDPERGSMNYVTAGHPPPLLVEPDGTATFLDGAVSWPLGVDLDADRVASADVSVPPGSLLVFYTDGLVERRGEPMERGLERLRDVVTRHATMPLRLLKQAIFSELVDASATDDIALVALRMAGTTSTVYATAMPAEATELAPARRRFRSWLAQAPDAGPDVEDVLLAVGEALANAIEHGSVEPTQIIRLEATISDGVLVVSVSDTGRWQPGLEGYFRGRGRGHLLMDALADSVDVDGDQHGTIVTLRFVGRPVLV
jgi:anti-sigma regulatory factor (Ser/Thr protein kinase)/PAS domain-containing protein